jgi:hypothetical protein
MEAGHYHDPMLLNLEEYPVRKAPHSGASAVPVDNRELQGTFCNCFNRDFDGRCETLPQLRANLLIPRARIQQILVCLWYPDNRKYHGFLNRPALTCCHGMTSEGFRSWLAIR